MRAVVSSIYKNMMSELRVECSCIRTFINLKRRFTYINCFVIWLIRLISTNIFGELQKICHIYIFFVKLTHVLDNCVRLTRQIVQSVKRLATGWKFRCPIPGGGGVIRQPYRGGPTHLSLLRLPDLSALYKAAGAWF